MHLLSILTVVLVVRVQASKVGRGCLTTKGEQGRCVKRDTCTQEDKQEELDNNVGHSTCSGGLTCCPYRGLCGVQQRGGRSVWPWLAIIRYGTRNICSGTLVSPTHILTSAMCVNAGPHYSVMVGHSQSNREIFNVSRVEIHPDFDLDTFTNNLAVVELSREVEISDDIMPACLMDTASHEGVLTEAGWATFESGDDTIVSREVEAIDNNECQELLDQSGLQFMNLTLGPSIFCTMDSQSPETCVGDLGGPLVRRNKQTDNVEVVGVRTIPLMCGAFGGEYPQIYTDITGYLPWIREIIHK